MYSQLSPRSGVRHQSLPKIFHMHLPKTAGTTINSWLDDLAHVIRCRPVGFGWKWGKEMSHGIFLQDVLQNPPDELPITSDIVHDEFETAETLYLRRANRLARARFSWDCYDILHGHESMMFVEIPGRFIFTILREPVARAISQYVDHRNLQLSDLDGLKSHVRRAVHSLMHDDIDVFIETMQDTDYFKSCYLDGQCRTLVQDTYLVEAFDQLSIEDRAAEAIKVLEKQINFVGIQELLPQTVRGLASALGVCPPSSLPVLNDRPNADRAIIPIAARDWLTEHNRADKILYDYVAAKFNQELNSYMAYDSTEFEKRHVSQRVQDLSPITAGPEQLFDMNMAIVGTGYHAREAPGTYDCIRWTGPESELCLYLPVPAEVPLRLRVYTKGWMDWDQRTKLAVTVNGQPAAHRFEYRPGSAEVITFEAQSNTNWLRLGVTSATTNLDVAAGEPSADRRLKGFALWRYSYEVLI